MRKKFVSLKKSIDIYQNRIYWNIMNFFDSEWSVKPVSDSYKYNMANIEKVNH